MKKQLFALLAALLLLAPALAAGKTDWEEMNLKGRVKALHSDWESIYFNDKGMITDVEYYDDYWMYFTDGYAGYQEYSYDEDGRLASLIEYDYDDNLVGQNKYEYDEEGRLSKLTEYYGLVSDTETYTYDEKGNLVKSRKEDEYGTLIRMSTHAYDAKGNKIRTVTYNPDTEEPSRISEFNYDPNGSLLEETVSDPDGAVLTRKTYKYDSKNRKTEYAEQDLATGKITTRTYKYDPQGNLTEETRSVKSGDETSLETLIYTNDEAGNWTQIESNKDGSTVITDTRSISYY
jgi:hypothetical protein